MGNDRPYRPDFFYNAFCCAMDRNGTEKEECYPGSILVFQHRRLSHSAELFHLSQRSGVYSRSIIRHDRLFAESVFYPKRQET